MAGTVTRLASVVVHVDLVIPVLEGGFDVLLVGHLGRGVGKVLAISLLLVLEDTSRNPGVGDACQFVTPNLNRIYLYIILYMYWFLVSIFVAFYNKTEVRYSAFNHLKRCL